MDHLFIDIPRTASSSIIEVVGRPDNIPEKMRHLTARDWEAFLGSRRFASYHRFTVVREPADRFRSAYNYLVGQRPGHRWYGADRAERTAIGSHTIDEVARWDRNRLFRLPHFKPQMAFLMGHRGTVMVGDILRYEQLEEAWREFAGVYGLPKSLPRLNASTSCADLAPDSLAALYETYAVDYETLNYPSKR